MKGRIVALFEQSMRTVSLSVLAVPLPWCAFTPNPPAAKFARLWILDWTRAVGLRVSSAGSAPPPTPPATASVAEGAMPAGRDGRGKPARGKVKGPEACHAENDQEGSAVEGQADKRRTRDVLGERSERNRNTAEQRARFAQKSGSEYDRLLADAMRQLNEGNSRPVEAAYRKAIALDPANPTAYYNLGCLCSNTGRRAEAAPNFVRAEALLWEESVEWASCISLAFDTLVHPACSEVAKPEWWNDKDLMALSKKAARVTGAAGVQQSRRVKGHLLRLHVLAAESGEFGWQVGPRSAADLNEAATHAGMAAELHLRSESSACSEMAVSLLSEAARLFRKAADMGVKESDAEAAKAAAQADREAAEAVAKADTEAAEAAAQAVVRAEAETKANAAAEALLAEEEAEAVALAAASSAPSKGKAKGKPKGKGKSSGKP